MSDNPNHNLSKEDTLPYNIKKDDGHIHSPVIGE